MPKGEGTGRDWDGAKEDGAGGGCEGGRRIGAKFRRQRISQTQEGSKEVMGDHLIRKRKNLKLKSQTESDREYLMQDHKRRYLIARKHKHKNRKTKKKKN